MLPPAPLTPRIPFSLQYKGSGGFLLDGIPRGIARPRDTLNTKRKLRRIGGREQSIVVRDDALLVPVHQRLIEALHAVRHRSFPDQLRNVERLGHVADLIAHRLGVDENLGCRYAPLSVA